MQLRSRVDNLGQTVRAHQRVETMDDANGITRLVAELATKYQTRIPYEVILLDYYGRQLELGIAGARLPLLKQTTADLRSTWNMIERTILERGKWTMPSASPTSSCSSKARAAWTNSSRPRGLSWRRSISFRTSSGTSVLSAMSPYTSLMVSVTFLPTARPEPVEGRAARQT